MSSAHMKATADKAALLAKAEALKRWTGNWETSASSKMELLEIEADTAATDARLKTPKEFENNGKMEKKPKRIFTSEWDENVRMIRQRNQNLA